MDTDTSAPLPGLPEKTRAALKKLGIITAADVQTAGAVQTFLLLKAAGLTVTDSILWRLQALAMPSGCVPMTDEEKTALRTAVRNHPPVAVFPSREEMRYFMGEALKEAKKAFEAGEVPVGAVVVSEGEIIGRGYNRSICSHDVSRHAEINALADAGAAIGNYRLPGCDLYVTLEPCCMCASAVLQARIGRLVFGATEPKTGAAGSVTDLFADKALNWQTAVSGGISAEESRQLLQQFFQSRRPASR